MVFGFAKESIRCIDPYNQHDNSGSHICKVSLRFFKKNLSVGCRWRVNNIGKVQEIKKKIKNDKYLSAIILGKLEVKLENILQV